MSRDPRIPESTLYGAAEVILHYLRDLGHDCLIPASDCAGCEAVQVLGELREESDAVRDLLDHEWNGPRSVTEVAGDTIEVVLDDAPGPDSGRFVEVENLKGESVSAGEWNERPDGKWALRIQGVQF